MFMRVAVAIHKGRIDKVIETYNLMSTKRFIHASPTLFHAGKTWPQMSSCFILPMGTRDIADTFKTLSDCAIITHHAGGIGLNVNNVPAAG